MSLLVGSRLKSENIEKNCNIVTEQLLEGSNCKLQRVSELALRQIIKSTIFKTYIHIQLFLLCLVISTYNNV